MKIGSLCKPQTKVQQSLVKDVLRFLIHTTHGLSPVNKDPLLFFTYDMENWKQNKTCCAWQIRGEILYYGKAHWDKVRLNESQGIFSILLYLARNLKKLMAYWIIKYDDDEDDDNNDNNNSNCSNLSSLFINIPFYLSV